MEKPNLKTCTGALHQDCLKLQRSGWDVETTKSRDNFEESRLSVFDFYFKNDFRILKDVLRILKDIPVIVSSLWDTIGH